MDDLQYRIAFMAEGSSWVYSFKPCYKWMTFNTLGLNLDIPIVTFSKVLNLVINGWPSILS